MPESIDLIQEHAYLVARGVRAIALVGHHVPGDDLAVHRTVARLESVAIAGAIPFVCEGRDGVVDYGYAATEWALDLYRWLSSAKENAVPAKHRHRILGLLLGYDLGAIVAYEQSATASAERAAK